MPGSIDVFDAVPPARSGSRSNPVEGWPQPVVYGRSGGPNRFYEYRDGEDRLVARCALWLDEWSPARIGCYEAADQAAGIAVLRRAMQDASEWGAGEVVGPMDGSTWRRYRFIVQRGDRPAFLLEPDNPDRYPEDWRAAGFEPIAHYVSSWCADASRRDPRLDRVRQRIDQAGVRLRPFDVDHFDAELRAIHEMSLVAFAENYLYRPIGLEAFVAMYEPLRALIVPESVQLAELDGQLVGYAFTIPDMAMAERGQAIDTLIVKTVAVKAGREFAGLGQLLMEEAQLAGHRQGYRHAIHALMHEANVSTRMSWHYAIPFRRYALYGQRTKR